MARIKHTVQRSSAFFPVLLLTAFLGACGGSGDDNDTAMPELDGQADEVLSGLVVGGLNGAPAEDLISPWLGVVRLFQNTTFPESSDVLVDLFRYDAGLTLSESIEFYTPELDTCDIIELNDAGGNGDDNEFSESVSGGTSVTINMGSGPWLELVRPNPSFPGFYLEVVGELGVLPMDATLSIPGDVFPNVPAYSLLDQPSAPVRLTPAAGVVTAVDVAAPFTWIPMPDRPGGYIEIVGVAFDAAGVFQGFPVSCNVVDDGEFILPQNVVDAFASSELVFETRFERGVGRLDLINGIVFSQVIQVRE